jgi:hypothetical protein
MKYLLILLIFIIPCLSYGATGDTLMTSLISDDPGAQGNRQIITGTGCVGNTGTCVKMNCTTGNCSAADLWALDIVDHAEVTIAWSEKFDVWPLTWTYGGCKSIRPYHGGGSGDYIGTLISFHSGNDMYGSFWENSATFLPTSKITHVYMNDDGCQSYNSGTGEYECNKSISYTWAGMGTTWHSMREWIKMPTSRTSGDGETKLWIDDELMYHLYSIDMQNTGVEPPAITSVNFAPVDESGTAHGHWYDNITIYEGYVPPGETAITAGPGVLGGKFSGGVKK